MAREKPYRDQALKILPWICTRCAREFPGERLRELTVHHRNHDHDFNPPDGSNWELLCIYCHENEHARVVDSRAGGSIKQPEAAPAKYRPLANLGTLLKDRKKK